MKVCNSKQNNNLRQGVVTLQDGSIELVVLGMLAALIVVLAIPLFIDGPAREAQQSGSPEATLENEKLQPVPRQNVEISPEESA
jgi:hypothetical protein